MQCCRRWQGCKLSAEALCMHVQAGAHGQAGRRGLERPPRLLEGLFIQVLLAAAGIQPQTAEAAAALWARICLILLVDTSLILRAQHALLPGRLIILCHAHTPQTGVHATNENKITAPSPGPRLQQREAQLYIVEVHPQRNR